MVLWRYARSSRLTRLHEPPTLNRSPLRLRGPQLKSFATEDVDLLQALFAVVFYFTSALEGALCWRLVLVSAPTLDVRCLSPTTEWC